MKEQYIKYLIEERARWEERLAGANLANQGYADRYSEQIERITEEIEKQLTNPEKP